MSLADVNLELPQGLPLHKQLQTRFLLGKTKKWLNAWYKNKDEFELKEFILLDREEDLIDCLIIVLINKKNLLEVMHDHESAFKQELGESFTPESFLENLEKRNVSLAQAIHKSQKLLGIMLGYGERNATLFQERFNLMKAASKRKKEDLPYDESLTQKLNTIKTQIGNFSEFEEKPIVPPLYFLADTSHSETISLKRKYAQDRQKIEALMQQPNLWTKF